MQNSYFYTTETITVKNHGTANNTNLVFENLVLAKYLIRIVCISLLDKYIQLFIQLFIMLTFIEYHRVSGTILGFGDTRENKTDQGVIPMVITFL